MGQKSVHAHSETVSWQDYTEICALWALRILVDLKAAKRSGMLLNGRTIDEDSMRGMGLGQYINTYHEPEDFHRILESRKAELEREEDTLYGMVLPGVRRMGEAFQIGETEQRLLAFAGLLEECAFLDDIADILGKLNTSATIDALGQILKLDRAAVKDALRADGPLSRTGLMRIDRNRNHTLGRKLEPLDAISELLFEPDYSVEQLLSAYFTPAPAARLMPDDYPHLAEAVQDLRSYLRAVRRKRVVGVNTLLYGPPGTGKTELARALAASLDGALHEIASMDEDGDPISGSKRLQAFQLAQHWLQSDPNALVLFDEVEDVFDDHNSPFGRLMRSSNNRKKGFTNKLLESNQVPAFWLTNDVDAIDPAFRRRFDFVLEVPNPPRAVRRRITERYLEGRPARPEWVEALSRNEAITPALLENASKVAGTIGFDDVGEFEARAERVVAGHLKAQGNTGLVKGQDKEVTAYKPEWVNPDRPLAPVIEGLVRRREGRLCLYGAPGTGKTAFVRYLAERMDRPLLLKRASDLLNAFVGETEARIARMFREAEDEGALLLLDEADSFLRDRQGAHRGWEVTQVNELLTQMEAFHGVFVCATNLVGNLDEAAGRRFDLKIEFNPLTIGQRIGLFNQVISEHGLAPIDPEELRSRFAELDGLTPGDFATAIRQAVLEGGPSSARALLHALEQEQAFKNRNASRPVGFTARL